MTIVTLRKFINPISPKSFLNRYSRIKKHYNKDEIKKIKKKQREFKWETFITFVTIPWVLTISPRDICSERFKQIIQHPCDNCVVVYANQEWNDQHGITNTWSCCRRKNVVKKSHNKKKNFTIDYWSIFTIS